MILAVIFAFGTLLRLQYLNKFQFPMNDGGLFYTMIQDLLNNGFSLPTYTSYNNLNIPFAYPPLSFYLAAWINQVFHLDLLTVIRFFPLVYNLASIPAFYMLSKELTENDRTALLAAAFYAVLNPAYEWLISGGGLTRSPAHTFFIVSLALFLAYLRTSRKRFFFLSMLSAALMTLHHIEYTWMLMYSVAIFTIFKWKKFKGLLVVAVYGLGIAVLTSPYWITIFRLHGLSPFLNAFSTGEFSLVNSLVRLILLNFTGEPFTSVVNILAMIGLFVCIAKKEYAVLAWFLAVVFLNDRSAYRSLIFPVSILAAFSLDAVIIPGLNQAGAAHSQNPILTTGPRPVKTRFLYGSIFSIFIVFVPFLLGYLDSFTDHPILSSVDSYELKAMDWVKANTLPSSSFLVIDSAENWSNDRVAEWFPAIAGRHSENTIQGMEWLPDKAFIKQRKIYEELKQCTGDGVSCLLSWADRNAVSFTHLFITRPDCTWNSANCTDYLVLTIESSTDFRKIFENQAVVIFQRSGS